MNKQFLEYMAALYGKIIARSLLKDHGDVISIKKEGVKTFFTMTDEFRIEFNPVHLLFSQGDQ
jgi:hypothetical protein